jgi:hypothetical protein
LEFGGICYVHLDAHDVGGRHPSRVKNRSDILQALPYFGVKIVWDLACGIFTALPRNVEGPVNQDALTVIPAWFGVGRGNDLLVYAESASIAEKSQQRHTQYR